MKPRHLLSSLLIAGLAFTAPVAAQDTTGSIEGSVQDDKGLPLPGAMISIMSSQGSKTGTTDANGRFRFEYLIPGSYSLKSSMHGFTPVEHSGINVGLGGRTRLLVTLPSGTSATIEVEGSAAVINLSSTTSGANISEDLMKSVPIGRNFASTLSLSPGVVDSGVGGSNPSISGASGLENTYQVDGVNINNTGYGSAGSYSIVFGSLGTGVNFDYIQEVQVKTGGYEPEFGEALGGFVNLITKSGGNEFKGSLYTYLRPGAFEGERTLTDRTNATVDTLESESYDAGAEIGGPLAENKAFFYGAFNPQFTKRSRRTATALQAVGIDNKADVDRTIWNYAANLKTFPNPKHSLGVSAFGDPSKGDNGPQRGSAFSVSNPEDRFSELTYGGHNVIGRWNGELMDNWFVEGSVAWHKDKFEEALSNNTPNGADFRVSPTLRYGGVGYFANSESRNVQYKGKTSLFFNAGGEHNVRVGLDIQDIAYDDSANYTGPSGLSLPGGIVSTSGYTWNITDSRFQLTRIRSGSLTNETTATYTAAHISDNWNINDMISIMAGVRYEKNKIVGGNAEMSLDDNWGPRFHVIVDPTRDGRTKISASYGRFFGKIPNDIAVRVFGGEISHLARYAVSDVDLSDPLNPMISGTPFQFFTFGDEPSEIDPDTKTSLQDEFKFGVERDLGNGVNLGGTFTFRNLDRALEDVGDLAYSTGVATSDFGHYIITNPVPADGYPEPSRKYTSFTAKADKRMSDNWQLLASYTWSKLEGNYEGFFRRDNGQSDPGLTSLYDWPYLEDPQIWAHIIADGVLPNDRTNVFNLHGSYSFDMNLNVGVGFRVASGMPLTRLGFNEAYGNGGEIPLEPRGTSGRGDTTNEFDLHLDYPIQVGSAQLSFIADVFNLFNQQNGVDYWMDYELGGTIDPDPSLGLAPCPTCLDPDFGKVLTFQTPRQVRLAARFSWGQ